MIEFEKNKSLRRNFSYNSCIIMIKILNIPDKTEFLTRSKIAKFIHIHPAHPNFTELIDYLKEIKIIIEKERIGNNRLLELDKKLLKDFIDEQDVLTWLSSNYLKKWCTEFRW